MVQPISAQDGSIIDPTSSNEDENEEKPRIRAKFDNLFAGMPSLSDIINSEEATSTDSAEATSSKRKSSIDEAWFAPEKEQIEQNYQVILRDMLEDLQQEETVQQQEGTDSIPENAEAMIRSVLQQECQAEIASTFQKRSQERLEQYEQEQRQAQASGDDADTITPGVQKLLDDSEAEYQQQEASRAELEDFLRYEQEAVVRQEKVVEPTPGQDLDQWALDRMEDMVQEKIDVEGGENVLDNLDQNVDDLRDRMQKEGARRGVERPESLKEWQMYRSIATAFTNGAQSEEGDYEEEIMEQLDSWKAYIEKEEGLRKKSGLSRGLRLPFDWQEYDLVDEPVQEKAVPDRFKDLNKIETRKQLNRMSIEALESLMVNSDAQRREKLQKEIDYLKSTLESNDYLDVDESFLMQEDAFTGPVDVSDVFQTSDEEEKSEKTRSYQIDNSAAEKVPESFFSDEPPADAMPPATPFFSNDRIADDLSPPSEEAAPPNTPFFSNQEPGETVPPPNTPFFSDPGTEEEEEKIISTGGKLGSMEDQKLEAMFRRAGAKTTEERNTIRAQWEDFQKIEKQKRDLSGLSGGDDEEFLSEADLKYNVSEVMKGDGDFDAEKILSTIGPRPKRRKQGAVSDAEPDSESENDFSQGSSVDQKEVMDSLYRSVSAIGGGRFRDDPEQDTKQKEEFQEFMKKESEMRESLDVVSEGETSAKQISDDVEYAEEVLASLGPRPQPKRTRITDEGGYSDMGGVLASESDDDDDDDDGIDNGNVVSAGDNDIIDSDTDPEMPEWLRRETEEARAGGATRTTFRGSEIDEVFDDTDYDHNMRQLAEYERRRAGKERQMGIDISDILGRSAYESDDYADYKFDSNYQRGRQDDWDATSFANKKANLLDYTELEVMELNALMDHKDSVYSTGVSQYLPRINKPFKEFGAIFRLEGVLVDITGLQLKAWTKVAEEYSYKAPSIEAVGQASVVRPDIAVKDCLFWTDDFLKCRKIADSHRKAFREVFDSWMHDAGIKANEENLVDPFPTKSGMALGEEVVTPAPVIQKHSPKSEYEKMRLATIAWSQTAEKFNKRAPDRNDILNALLISPDIAILEVFQWTSEPQEADMIARSFREFFKIAEGGDGEKISPVPPPANEPQQPSKPLTQNEVMEIHYRVWMAVAESFGFEKPVADEVVAAFVINDPLIAIRDGYGWTSDPKTLADAVNMFQEGLSELLPRSMMSRTPILSSENSTPRTATGGTLTDQEENFKTAFDCWTAVAERSGLPLPDNEQVLFALTVGPEEGVLTGFQWTEDPNQMKTLTTLYREELAKRRGEPASPLPGTTTASTASSPSKKGPSQDDIFRAVMNAWSVTAARRGYEAPDAEQIQFAFSVGAEEAVVTGFQWTENPTEVAEIVEEYKQELAASRSAWYDEGESDQGAGTSTSSDSAVDPVKVLQGGAEWIESLLAVEMQCAVVSHLDRDQLDVLLQYAGLENLFGNDKRVSASNGYTRDSQQMLGASLRLERRPDHCVMFDTSPHSSAAAHESDMRSVNLIGPYPRYELLSADTAMSSFDELTAINIRRLFGERVYDQPMLDIQQAEPETKRRTKTKFFWDDD